MALNNNVRKIVTEDLRLNDFQCVFVLTFLWLWLEIDEIKVKTLEKFDRYFEKLFFFIRVNLISEHVWYDCEKIFSF